MKNVVHLTSAHPRYDQRILWRECCSLREHGYDVTLIVNDAKENETLENGVRILSTGFVPQGRRERMTEGVKRVYTLGIAQNADIYHLHDAELLTIALKLKRNGKKVIFDSHEFYGETIKGRTWIPWGCRYLVSFLYNCYETYVCKRIDGVIAVGKYDGKDWFANRSKRFTVVGNFPPKDEYQDIPIPSYRLRANICYAGGLSEETGVLNLLEAAAKAQTRLLLAGRFSSEAFHEKCMENDTNHVVDYFGQIGRKDVFTMYGKCAIGICIPLNMGGQEYKINTLNTKIYEYMAMEMPFPIGHIDGKWWKNTILG